MHLSFYPQQHFHNHYKSTMCKSTRRHRNASTIKHSHLRMTQVTAVHRWHSYSFVSDRCVYLIITEAAFEICELTQSRVLHIMLGTEHGWKHSAPSPQGISIITHPKVVLWAFWKLSLSSITYRTLYGRIGISMMPAFLIPGRTGSLLLSVEKRLIALCLEAQVIPE